MLNNIPDIILEETKQLPDDLLKELLENLQLLIKNEELQGIHVECEFENYKVLFPKE